MQEQPGPPGTEASGQPGSYSEGSKQLPGRRTSYSAKPVIRAAATISAPPVLAPVSQLPGIPGCSH